ncbi:S8 family peptidase [Fictibacillus iocasae]|uniref:S8 family peptidase n=1 Tax=Fictibacillus iocasae TaxID=2715437 RepID=A0ABW2NRM3_9BACL
MNQENTLNPVLIHKLSQTEDHSDETFPAVIVLKSTSILTDLSQLCKLEPCDKPRDRLPYVQMFTGDFCKKTLLCLAAHTDVQAISDDYQVRSHLDIATPSVGAITVKNDFGLTGAGVTIAVVDTGVFPHPDLTQPTNRIINFVDFVNGRTAPYDDNGHGTHVTGDAAGNGRSSGGKYISPAPEARIVGVKVLDRFGFGTVTQIVNGINYVIQFKNTFNIRIMNLSLGGEPTTSYLTDPIATACRRAWIRGILVVAAAGNTGPNGPTNTPGYDPLILTVGAIDDMNTLNRADDVPALYTSVKPTFDGFIKADIEVPGTDIISLLAPNSFIFQQNPQNFVSPNYFRLTGTSMASGVATGMLAQFLQAYPPLTPDVVKVRYVETTQFFANDTPGYAIQPRVFSLQINIANLST